MAALAVVLGTLACAQQVDLASRPLRYERSRGYDVQHYRIQLSLDAARRSFAGEAAVTLVPMRDHLEELTLDAETFTVDGVTDAAGTPLTFNHSNGQLRIRLAAPKAHGETVEVRVRYHADAVQPDPEKFGMPRGYDLGLSFKDASATNPALASTLSFPEGARHWFPCYDHPNDKATSEVIATVREDFQVVSNGRLVSTSADGEAKTRTFHWLQDKPHSTYLMVLVAGPYVEVKDPEPGHSVSYWVYPAAQADAVRTFGKTREIIRFFEQEFGVPYPWAKYHQITIPGIGGGAESTTASVIGDVQIHDQRAEQDFPSHWLVAHEAAHQWWGDLVTMRDWTHTWINEGFATYYEHLYLASSEGEDEGAIDRLKKRDAYLTEVSTSYQRPIVSPRWEVPNQNFDRHTYQKGALVLRQLRWVMGDAPFRRAITHFLEKHAYQSADTHDLLIAIREATGQVLDWYFDDWILRSGHPVFTVEQRWLDAERVLEVKVTQTQAVQQDGPLFRVPVQFGFVTQEGKRIETVWLRDRQHTFRFSLPQKPLLVRFDEGNYLLCELHFPKTVDELLYQLSHDDVTGRMWAAQQLAKYPSDARVWDALQRSAGSDPFWGVRREATRATAGFEHRDLVPFWQQRASDGKSAVRVAAIQLLASRQDPALRSWFLETFRNDDSYLAQAEALRALGTCGSKEDLAFLRAAATQASPRDVIRRAAQEAIRSLEGK